MRTEGILLNSLVLSADGAVPEWVQLIPPGKVQTTQGAFVMDDAAWALVRAAFQSKARDLVFDYEHQTLKSVEAPASGWIKELDWRGVGDATTGGLWGRIEWTERARTYIAAKEYRYHSPVMWVDGRTGRVAELRHAGLTNDPAIRGIRPIANKDEGTQQEDTRMKDRLCTVLALKAEATDDEIVAAVEGLQGFRKDMVEGLALKAEATPAEARGALLALKNPSGQVSAADFQALQRRLDEREVQDLVEQALKDGKVAPAQKAWANEYALKDRDGFKAFLAQATPVVPVGGRTAGGQGTAGGSVSLSEYEEQVCRDLGLKPEEFKALKGKED